MTSHSSVLHRHPSLNSCYSLCTLQTFLKSTPSLQMVILGGLELVAAGYLLHEHGKYKKEKQRIEQEEARLRNERRQRRRKQRRHSGSPDHSDDDGRRRSDTKYDYVPASTLKPPNAGSSTLGVPTGPPGRASSQPPPGYAFNANPAYPPSFPPPPNQPVAPPHGYPYGQYPPPFPPPQSQQGPVPGPGLSADYYNPNNKYGSDRGRQRSDSDPYLPAGIAELSADGPWMHDMHRTSHQTPHVRFNVPDNVPQPGDDRSPPPAYRP